jgi:hypothetical protein
MVKAWAAPAESVKTGAAFREGRRGCWGVWFVLSLDTSPKKKDLKAKYATHLEDLPYKKTRHNYYCSLSSYRVLVFKMNFEFHQPIRWIIVAIK